MQAGLGLQVRISYQCRFLVLCRDLFVMKCNCHQFDKYFAKQGYYNYILYYRGLQSIIFLTLGYFYRKSVTTSTRKLLLNDLKELEAKVGQKSLHEDVTLCYDGHPGYLISFPLAIQNLTLSEEFQDFHNGRHPIGTERFSNSESPCHPNASHQVSAQS